MGEAWHLPPSHWLPHLHPLQKYHLDQALYAKWQEQERRNRAERDRLRPPDRPARGPRAGPPRGLARLTPEKQQRFRELQAQIAATRQVEREQAG